MHTLMTLGLQACLSSGLEDARFELGVIEHVLNECTDLFDRRIRLMDPLVRNLLHDNSDDDDGDFEGLQVGTRYLSRMCYCSRWLGFDCTLIGSL